MQLGDVCVQLMLDLVHGCKGRVLTQPGKSWNFRKEFSTPGKSWKMTVVMESHEKVMEFHQWRSWNFLTEGMTSCDHGK